MIPRHYVGKPVIYIDEVSCDIVVSEHPIRGVKRIVEKTQPSLTRDEADGIAYRIHLAICEYLLATFVMARRRRRGEVVWELTRTANSPAVVLRRIREAIEARDIGRFYKNFDLLNCRTTRIIHSFIADEVWLAPALERIFPGSTDFRRSCNSCGFVFPTRCLMDDATSDLRFAIMIVDLTISKLKTKGRPSQTERDFAAAQVLLQYFGFILSDWSGPQQPSHSIGTSLRAGPVVEFLSEIEECYGLTTPALSLLPRTSGAAWARVNKLVDQKMQLSGAA